MIYPRDKAFIFLLLLNMMILIYTVIYLPYDLAFNPNSTWTIVFNQSMNVLFLTEIVTTVFTA